MRCSKTERLYSVLALLICLLPGIAIAQNTRGKGNVWSLRTSLYTQHFSAAPEHNNQQGLVNLEVRTASDNVAGIALFSNSFHQATQVAYAGRIWRFSNLPGLHLKLVGGLIHGYHGQYRDKIPLNRYGIAPMVLPALGYSNGPFSTELVLFGTAGLMVTIGWNAR